jgi:Uma2 family endonuclease
MSSVAKTNIAKTREFVPGTTGWTADDLDDPEIERLWEAGHYEIVEGVLTLMPPAFFDGGASLYSLVRLIDRHIEIHGPKGRFAPEADLIVDRKRVARPDFVFLTEADMKQQRERRMPKSRPMMKYGRLRIAPMLVIESISVGHEDHDRETKRAWYAQAGVPNYWLLNAYTQSLECLKLVKNDYRRDAWGREKDELRPSAFPGLIIPLRDLWV